MKTLHGTVSFARNIEELFDGLSGFRYPVQDSADLRKWLAGAEGRALQQIRLSGFKTVPASEVARAFFIMSGIPCGRNLPEQEIHAIIKIRFS